MNLVGITNENEFIQTIILVKYLKKIQAIKSHHGKKKKNQDENYKTPFKRLHGIGPSYLTSQRTQQKKLKNRKRKPSSKREICIFSLHSLIMNINKRKGYMS